MNGHLLFCQEIGVFRLIFLEYKTTMFFSFLFLSLSLTIDRIRYYGNVNLVTSRQKSTEYNNQIFSLIKSYILVRHVTYT
mgnify:CR=1 FL=1